MNLIPPRQLPNEEQEKAIYHNGGKLLSAGAGSGKTFVLIEHLVFLLEHMSKKIPRSDWDKLIGTEMAKMVLMTFTKKAAGEMSIRLMKRVDTLISESLDVADEVGATYWSLIRKNLSSLSITTIHAFCYRLLALNYLGNFPKKINLISSVEHKSKIQKLFDRWFVGKKEILDPVFLGNSNALLVAMFEIFSSPETRLLWKNLKAADNLTDEINNFFSQFIEVRGYGFLFFDEIDISCNEKEKDKKWYELLIKFKNIATEKGIICSSNYTSYCELFKSFSRFPNSNSKEISEHQKKILEALKNLKSDLKELGQDLEAMSENFPIYQMWVNTIGDLFQFINKNYLEIDGLSFADLEYYVLMSLQELDVRKKVEENFSYFIVDEFQDTSFVQFEILKKLTNLDPNKIFCVGDRKQAIYGFRGGELQVFADCAKYLGVENNYFLKNNFRSRGSVVKFNNQLFSLVFPLGAKYEGKDPHGSEMEIQVVPLNNFPDEGEVLALRTEITGDLTELNLDQLEAKALNQQIEILLLRNEIENICVLYRKLKPSTYLLEYLLTANIAFKAQIKIKFADDPQLNIFLYLVEINLNQSNPLKKEASIALLKILLDILGIKNFNNSLIDKFNMDIKIIGLRLAYHKFIFCTGMTNSQHAQNTNLIDAICRLTKEDLKSIYHLLKNEDDEEYSCEMINGKKNKKRIIVMSAHASKGLEFDAVLLGGVHANGRYNGLKAHVGKMPYSFKWKKSFNQKSFFKSLSYYLESEILALKDFSESKRLLYVACTRAIRHLSFVDLWCMEKNTPKNLYFYENSWIQALRLSTADTVQRSMINKSYKKNEISLIQRDSLGILTRSENLLLGIVSELSVTRFSLIADCPFKFYLHNICKINSENKPHRLDFLNEENEEEVFYSSKKRGTQVHKYLSQLFLKEIDFSELPPQEKSKILWAYSLADRFKNRFEIITEKLIKFSFFGQMISGTPDLVLKSANELVIWDFKTGLRNQETEESYWLQLMCYAHAYACQMSFPLEQKIELVLLYLDQQDAITKNISYNEITQILFSYWVKTESLCQVNLQHCLFCEYSVICQKGEKSTALAN